MMQRVLEREPDHVEAHLQLAYAHDAAGDERASLASIERVLTLDPECADAHCLRARLALAQQDLPTACWHSETACALDVTHFAYTLTHCEVLARQGELTRAREYLQEKVLGRSIDDARIWRQVANVAELLRDDVLAKRAWSAVLERDPAVVSQIYDEGRQHFARGEFDRAARCFSQCWHMAPDDRRVVNALLSALSRWSPDEPDRQLEQELARCLAHEGIDPHHLRDVASRQVLRKPAIVRILALPFPQ